MNKEKLFVIEIVDNKIKLIESEGLMNVVNSSDDNQKKIVSKALSKEFKKILAMLKVSETGMTTAEFQKTVLGRFDQIDKRLDKVESDITDLKSDVSDLKTRMSNIETKVSNIETRVSTLEANK